MQNLDAVKHGTTDVPVEEIFLRRWSPRAFAEQAVSDRDLRVVFSAGGWAASCFNEQPWRFLVGRKGDSSWTRIRQALVASNQAWASSAPVLYASFAKRTFTLNNEPNRVAQHDVGAASAQMALQATALGLYVHGMVGFDPEKLKSVFNVPDDFESVACWALGYLGNSRNSQRRSTMSVQWYRHGTVRFGLATHGGVFALCPTNPRKVSPS